MPSVSQTTVPFSAGPPTHHCVANVAQLPETAAAPARAAARLAGNAGVRKLGRDRRARSPIAAYGSLERAFAACGLIAAAGTTGGAVLVVHGYGAPPLLAATSLALLLCAGLGIRALERVMQFQRGEVARVYANAVEAPRRAVFERRGNDATRMETLGVAMADLVDSVRLRVFGGDHVRTWALAMRRALDDRTATTRVLAAALSEDAYAITAAATAARKIETEVSDDIGAMFAHAGRAAEATTTLADETDSLQASMRETTTRLRQASSLAASLADNAMDAQRGVSSVADLTVNVLRAADQVRAVLVRAEMVGMNAGIEAAHAGEAGRGFAVVAGEVKSLATAAQQALEVMMQAVRVLKDDAVAMTRTVGVISEGVEANGALGQALSDAVSHQMDEVARVVARAGVAKSEIVFLHQRASAMGKRDLVPDGGPAARAAVERLPAHAEAIAKILRDLPSFEPAKS